jgi:hypothetical protein
MRRGTWAAAALVAVATFLWSSGVSLAHPGHEIGGQDGIVNTSREVFSNQKTAQHGRRGGHLPPKRQNVQLLSKVETTTAEGRVSDVAFNPNTEFAYVGKWAGGASPPACSGGVWPINVSDPFSPVRRPFMASHRNTYATEGIQVLTDVDTADFTGDLLLISNETCGPGGVGGLTIWDVTTPTRPVKLSEGVGDFVSAPPPAEPDPVAHDAHSVMGWNDGANAYAIAIDNIDGNDGDLDFFDISDPVNPVWLSETGIDDWPSAEVNAFGDFPTSHDFDVREIGGTWYAMVSYWDAGWVLLNVDDPANPVFIEDSEYKPCDDFVPTACPPEGNAHQGEWDLDGNTFIGTDEDFSAYRLLFDVTTGPHAGPYEAGEFSWTTPIINEPDNSMNGPTIFGGYGCPQSTDDVPTAAEAREMYDITLEENEDLILVTQRGPVQDPNAPYEACFFSQKVEFAQDLGYDGAIVANHHVGAGGQPGGGGHFAHAFICGSQGHVFTPTIPGTCVGHEAMHHFFDTGEEPQTYPPDFTVPYPVGDPGDVEPDAGDLGAEVVATAQFDGWGHARLLDADAPGLPEVDSYTIPETHDEAFAQGFGDLTVHEVATELLDPTQEHMAYFAWYSGGFRVAKFDEDSVEEVGAFIDRGGNNFWGVQITDMKWRGRRIVVASDRDFGLYVFRYTGSLTPPAP